MMKKAKREFLKALKEEGISKRITDTMKDIDREIFFDPFFHDRVYGPKPVPIGYGETGENPLLLAKMIELLDIGKSWKVLEVGTGSGYSTAVLSELASEVVTVEYHEPLARMAKDRLLEEGFLNIKYLAGDATDLVEETRRFDAIIIFAACTQRPFSLFSLLKRNGHAVFPMGPAFQQRVTFFKNTPNELVNNSLKQLTFHDYCQFDSIRGQYGWMDQQRPEEEADDDKDEEEKAKEQDQ